MLVLSRRFGQKIFIGPDIVVQVVDIDRGIVRIGIEAPRSLQILREELVPLVDDPRPHDDDKGGAE